MRVEAQWVAALLSWIVLATWAPSAFGDTAPARVGTQRVVLETDFGDLVLALYPDIAPHHVGRILDLARSGAYDGTQFYRIILGYHLQTSSVFNRRESLSPEQLAATAPLAAEFSNIPHVPGTLSMSRNPDDPNSASSSFMIFLGPGPKLDGRYTVFGRLESGASVAARIQEVPTGDDSRPERRVTIRKARIVVDIESYYEQNPRDPITETSFEVRAAKRRATVAPAAPGSSERPLRLVTVLWVVLPIAGITALFSWLGRGRHRAATFDHFAVAFFIVIWLFPFGYMGITNDYVSREWPRAVRYLHNASCLFRRNVERWSEYYIQGLPAGSSKWIELPDHIYSPMNPFGYESRMGFILQNHQHARSYNGKLQEWEMAHWYREKYAEINPDEPPLVSWRIVYVSYPVGEITPGAPGCWKTLPTDELAEDQLKPMATIHFEDGEG